MARGKVCDMGGRPGHVARDCEMLAQTFSVWAFLRERLEQADRLNPDISFQQNMMSTDLRTSHRSAHREIAGFRAIVNVPKESLPSISRAMRGVLQNREDCCCSHSHLGDATPSCRGVCGVSQYQWTGSFPDTGNQKLSRSRGICDRTRSISAGVIYQS